MEYKKLPQFFLSEEKTTNYLFFYFFFDSYLLFPGIQALQATFNVVLIAAYLTKALQTKCKTCFGGPTMILRAL